ncbi:MAG: FKBP-type peptidyl-prolyl cis-trans isomerase [Phocaeicola sp.]
MENKYITVAYKLYVMQDGQETMVEEAPVQHPFQFISGLGSTLDRFEKEVVALNKGEQFDFTIPCAEGYGEYMEEGVRTVGKDMFTIDGVFDEEHIYTGSVVPLQDNEGNQFYATVGEITADTVTVDLNHPHAGKDLTFRGEVVELRDATTAEVEQMINMLGGGGGCGCGSGGCGSDCGSDCGSGCDEEEGGCCGGGHCH